MKCQICHMNDANIVFTQIVNNEKVVLHICSECANKKGITIEFEKPSQPKQAQVFPDAFDTVIDEEDDEQTEDDLVCGECGLTFAEFKREGLFGCPQCHLAFGGYVTNLLKQIHGASVYHGSQPGEITEEGRKVRELSSLKKELRTCIEAEEYERAATLRDRIAELEGK